MFKKRKNIPSIRAKRQQLILLNSILEDIKYSLRRFGDASYFALENICEMIRRIN